MMNKLKNSENYGYDFTSERGIWGDVSFVGKLERSLADCMCHFIGRRMPSRPTPLIFTARAHFNALDLIHLFSKTFLFPKSLKIYILVCI